MRADGNADVFEQINLSGEPFIPEIQAQFGEEPKTPAPLLGFYKQYLHLKEFRERYQAYWNSTAKNSQTGQLASSISISREVRQVQVD